jgi:predicted short-subunit dehydrogenase-like oxidoreductase (DUF2520 family)
MNVSFIGSGNLATHLATALDNTDFPVREVFSPNIKNAKALVEKLYEAKAVPSLDFSSSRSKIFIIAVPDDEIRGVIEQLIIPANAILLHTSGSQPISLFGYAPTNNTGVFYPLQTFTKEKKVDWREIPIFIESENPETEKVMLSMANAISKKIIKITSAQRKALHVAAVFASNFTNHMLTLANDIASNNKIDFNYLKPLIVETINKSLSIGPENAQTGPAKRGDLEVLDNHMQFLEYDQTLSEIYRIVSQHILDRYSEN